MRRVKWSGGSTSRNKGDQRGQMPNALRIGLLGPLQVRDETGRPVRVGGRQLRVLLILLALDAGRVAPAGSLAGEIWPDGLPGNPETRCTRWFPACGPNCARPGSTT